MYIYLCRERYAISFKVIDDSMTSIQYENVHILFTFNELEMANLLIIFCCLSRNSYRFILNIILSSFLSHLRTEKFIIMGFFYQLTSQVKHIERFVFTHFISSSILTSYRFVSKLNENYSSTHMEFKWWIFKIYILFFFLSVVSCSWLRSCLKISAKNFMLLPWGQELALK